MSKQSVKIGHDNFHAVTESSLKYRRVWVTENILELYLELRISNVSRVPGDPKAIMVPPSLTIN